MSRLGPWLVVVGIIVAAGIATAWTRGQAKPRVWYAYVNNPGDVVKHVKIVGGIKDAIVAHNGIAHGPGGLTVELASIDYAQRGFAQRPKPDLGWRWDGSALVDGDPDPWSLHPGVTQAFTGNPCEPGLPVRDVSMHISGPGISQRAVSERMHTFGFLPGSGTTAYLNVPDGQTTFPVAIPDATSTTYYYAIGLGQPQVVADVTVPPQPHPGTVVAEGPWGRVRELSMKQEENQFTSFYPQAERQFVFDQADELHRTAVDKMVAIRASGTLAQVEANFEKHCFVLPESSQATGAKDPVVRVKVIGVPLTWFRFDNIHWSPSRSAYAGAYIDHAGDAAIKSAPGSKFKLVGIASIRPTQAFPPDLLARFYGGGTYPPDDKKVTTYEFLPATSAIFAPDGKPWLAFPYRSETNFPVNSKPAGQATPKTHAAIIRTGKDVPPAHVEIFAVSDHGARNGPALETDDLAFPPGVARYMPEKDNQAVMFNAPPGIHRVQVVVTPSTDDWHTVGRFGVPSISPPTPAILDDMHAGRITMNSVMIYQRPNHTIDLWSLGEHSRMTIKTGIARWSEQGGEVRTIAKLRNGKTVTLSPEQQVGFDCEIDFRLMLNGESIQHGSGVRLSDVDHFEIQQRNRKAPVSFTADLPKV